MYIYIYIYIYIHGYVFMYICSAYCFFDVFLSFYCGDLPKCFCRLPSVVFERFSVAVGFSCEIILCEISCSRRPSPRRRRLPQPWEPFANVAAAATRGRRPRCSQDRLLRWWDSIQEFRIRCCTEDGRCEAGSGAWHADTPWGACTTTAGRVRRSTSQRSRPR